MPRYIDPDDTYDESTNPSNGWRVAEPDVHPDYGVEFEVVCLECGAQFTTIDGDYCEVCGGSDLDLA